MFEKIEIFDKRYSELSQRLYEPSVAADPEQYQKTMKELKSIEEIVLTYREYKQAVKSQDESIEILEESGDSDLKELAQLELDEAKQNIEKLSEKLKILLLPKDPMMNEMLLWKFVAEQAAKSRHCSVRCFSECTVCMPRKRVIK